MKLDGQWFGRLEADATVGDIIVNLDRRRDGWSGTAIIAERQGLPGETHAITLYANTNGSLKGHSDWRSYFTYRKDKLQFVPLSELKKEFPQITSQIFHSELCGQIDEVTLSFDYSVDGKVVGTVKCRPIRLPDSTTLEPQSLSWDQFKALATKSKDDRRLPIYRGQSRPWPLQTSFHRAGRFDLHRFSIEDIQRLESAVTSVLDTPFQLNDTRHLGALLGIAQHHGFPTPLLDWTKSPYVAAYFACRDVLQSGECMPIVYRFNRTSWTAAHPAARDTSEPMPALGFIEPLPLKNARLMPQQSVLVFCNVHDFEAFVKFREHANKDTYLEAYRLTDKPATILRDLRMMGVYAASLFPGLDGMCRGVFEDSIEAD